MKGVSNTKLKSFAIIALLSTLLLFPAIATSNDEPSTTKLQYDRDDPNYEYDTIEKLAVRFTPPRVWLGTNYVCTLYEITRISLYVSSESWDNSDGFVVRLEDQNFNFLKSFSDQHPTENGWFDVDLTGWTDNTRYVDTHFHIVFNPIGLTDFENRAILWFDEAKVDEGEVSAQRSYIHTHIPSDPNSYPYGKWYPIELAEPCLPGDLMIRVELEPKTPSSILQGLRDKIASAEGMVFKEKAQTVKATLTKKINEAISMFERGSCKAGFNKLLNDIAPKLADPRPTPSTSWLKLYKDPDDQKLVSSFAVVCQALVQMAQKSASLPGKTERCDFNSDSYDDLSIGVPYENIDGKENAGALNVLYGSPAGITEENDQYWVQGRDGLKGESHTDDNFGIAIAIGDFNNDGCDDLAAGAPGDDGGRDNQIIADVGSVSVIYGSESGLTELGDQQWSQYSITLDPFAWWSYERFGSAVASGDFNGDGYDDLAVGVPGEYSGDVDSGEVDILYGSSVGLTSSGNQVWSQELLEGLPERDDNFGETLTVGDFNADGFEDLAVGVPNEDIGDIDDAGAVNIIYGSITGLTVTGNQIWHQDVDLIQGQCKAEDFFGGSLAAGDFDGDGYDDLAAGVPGEDYQDPYWEYTVKGTVNIIYGSPSGLSPEGNEIVLPRWWFRYAECDDFDYIGASLAAADFDQDGYEDLAIGIPGADLGWNQQSWTDAGAVYIAYGSSLGLPDPNPNSDPATTRWDIWIEADVPYSSLALSDFSDDYFGGALTVGHFNEDLFSDLAIGVPRAESALYADDQAGVVKVMYGTSSGLSTSSYSTWWQDKEGINGDSEDDDYLGRSLPGSQWKGIYP